MSNPLNSMGMQHPEDGQLLRYLDGELPRRKARQVKQHLEACWQCRAELEELQTTVADCVKYRKQVIGSCLPPPPEPWKDLSREFDRIDATVAGGSFASHLMNLVTLRAFAAPVRWAAVCAALLAVAVMTVNQLRETPSVQAAALLKRAVVVAESRPHVVRRVSITTRTRHFTKLIGAGLQVQTAASGEAELAAMFREAKYNFEDPLSARSFTDWHDHLAAKQDSVNTVPDRQSPDQNAYEIKTTTGDGSLLVATLKLRMTDYEPLEGRFEFRNRDWVEMTELVDQQTLPASTLAGTTGGTPRQPGVPPAFIAAPAEANPPAGVNSELQVVEALHQVGADLGDPVEISREGRQVLVSGTGIPPKRQAELHAVLDPLPNVVVRFADPAFPASNPPVQPEPAPTRDAAGPENRQLQARIEERLGGRPQFERFSGQLLDWTESAMARAYALRRLAQEFPEEGDRLMSPADRRALRNLGREHLAAFAADTARIDKTLAPILVGLGAVRGKAEPHATSGWQPAAEELLTAARRVESLLAVALGAVPGDRSQDRDQVPAQLMSGLAQLTACIEQCQRHLSYDDVRQSK